jgi:hypothetical protein
METHDMQVWVFGDMTDAGIIERLATGYNPGFAPQQLQPPVRVHPSWLLGSGRFTRRRPT